MEKKTGIKNDIRDTQRNLRDFDKIDDLPSRNTVGSHNCNSEQNLPPKTLADTPTKNFESDSPPTHVETTRNILQREIYN